MFQSNVKGTVGKVFLALLVAIVFLTMPTGVHEARAKELKLTMATYVPVGYPLVYDEQKIFVDRVNELGKGVVQIDMYWGGTLLKGKEILPGLQAGTADIVFQTGAYLLGSFPILGVQMLPIWTSVDQSHGKLKMGSPLAELQNEALKEKNIYQVAIGATVAEYLWTKDKQIRRPEDMKGLKIRVAGKVEAIAIKSLGAAPVTMPSAELPQALQRGVVDGALMNPWSARGRGVEEFCKYMLIYSLSNQSTPIYVKLDTWDKWPENVRKILIQAAADWEKGMVQLFHEKYNLEKTVLPYYEKVGMKAVYLNEEETKAFDKALNPVVGWWTKEVGADVGNKALELARSK